MDGLASSAVAEKLAAIDAGRCLRERAERGWKVNIDAILAKCQRSSGTLRIVSISRVAAESIGVINIPMTNRVKGLSSLPRSQEAR